MTVLIAAACRSPFTGVDGALAGWHPVDLAAEVMHHAVGRAGFTPADVDEVWIGCAEPVGAQGANMARAAVLAAGWPDHIGGAVIDRAETSGTAALHAAVAAIASGTIERAMVVGICNASVVQPGAGALGRIYGRPWGDGVARRVEDEGGLLPGPAAADRAASRAAIDRAAQDAWTERSHTRRPARPGPGVMAIAARPGDRVPVQRGAPVTTDEARALPDDFATLPPAFEADGAVTGFSFAAAADGAAGLVLVSGPQVETLPAILGCGRAAGHPLDPTGGLPAAAAMALSQAGLEIGDVDRWELTETTAAGTLLAVATLGVDASRVNRTGGTLAVGDAAAAEEIRLVTDGTAHAGPGTVIAAASYGLSGAAVTVIGCP